MTDTPLKNARQEKFAVLVAQGMAAGPAYAKAGYKTKTLRDRDSAASRLSGNVMVRERVKFLQNLAADKAVDTVAEITKDSAVTKEMVKGMLLLQARRNLGLETVKHKMVAKTGKKKGQVIEVEVTAYDATAANQTLKLLGMEVGLYEGGSASQKEDGTDIDSRAGVAAPHIIEEIEGLKAARRLVLAGGKDVEREARKVAIGAALKKLAGEK